MMQRINQHYINFVPHREHRVLQLQINADFLIPVDSAANTSLMTAKKNYSIILSYMRRNSAIYGTYNNILETVKFGVRDVA
jgi:hypothetical protein